jgi:malate dehydrogenase (oxaloacetate-decarboxylating)(NADP+)
VISLSQRHVVLLNSVADRGLSPAVPRDPVVFACANPTPEIDPDLARATREDVIMCTGRSDFPNQINNVCAFPYIFRGALDCRAKCVPGGAAAAAAAASGHA